MRVRIQGSIPTSIAVLQHVTHSRNVMVNAHAAGLSLCILAGFLDACNLPIDQGSAATLCLSACHTFS